MALTSLGTNVDGLADGGVEEEHHDETALSMSDEEADLRTGDLAAKVSDSRQELSPESLGPASL